jgi:hypothetical protein
MRAVKNNLPTPPWGNWGGGRNSSLDGTVKSSEGPRFWEGKGERGRNEPMLVLAQREVCHVLPYSNENGGPIAGTAVRDDTM